MPNRRIVLSAVIMLLLVLVLGAQLVYLQVVKHEHFTTLSQHNRIKVLPIPPIRGSIFSKDGVMLAKNRPSFSLEITPENVDDVDATIFELRKIIRITDFDVEQFNFLLKQKKRYESIPLRFDLNENEVSAFAISRHRHSGVDIIARLHRYYPIAEEFAHIIGYVAEIDEDDIKHLDDVNYRGTTHTGKLGIEKAYEKMLHGTVGYRQVEVNAEGRIIRVLERTSPKSGDNVHLTLNVALQRTAFASLAGRKGAIVALDPNTGDVLASVSSPGYDPNLFVNGIDLAAYQALLQSKQTPLINRAIQGQYSPGSTIKPFIGFAALEAGVRDHTDETWCPGWYSLKGHNHRYRDWKKQGHSATDFNKAVTQSCDVYFYALAHDLGIERIHGALQQFGFGKATQIDISGESKGLIPSREWKQKALGESWYPGETLILGIGQGYMLVTPIQLARATAALANGGALIKPRLVSKISNPISDATRILEPVIENNVAIDNPDNWTSVTHAMRDVVHGAGGTAWRSGLEAGYEFAGKTGTTQVIGLDQDQEYDEDVIPVELQDHALFIAYAPVEQPKIAVAIIVENGGSGARTAAPIARKLFDNYLLGDE